MSDNTRDVQELLSQKRRSPVDASTNGRRLVLDPQTGKLVVQDSNTASVQDEGVPLQSVGGWANSNL